MTHNTAYAKKWRHERLHGHLRYTPAEPLAAHVRDLLAAGHSRRAIAEAASLSPTAITRIADGTTRQLQAATAHRLSRLTSAGLYDRARPAGFVPLLGARRRLQALMALGHDALTIAQSVDGLRAPDVYNALNRQGRWITRTQADLIDQAYAALSMHPGTNRHTRGRALAKSWAPPLAWDDIDDPRETPNGVAA